MSLVTESRLSAAVLIVIFTTSYSYADCASHAAKAAALARELYIHKQNWLQTEAAIEAAETEADTEELQSLQRTNLRKYSETIDSIISRGKRIFDECDSR